MQSVLFRTRVAAVSALSNPGCSGQCSFEPGLLRSVLFRTRVAPVSALSNPGCSGQCSFEPGLLRSVLFRTRVAPVSALSNPGCFGFVAYNNVSPSRRIIQQRHGAVVVSRGVALCPCLPHTTRVLSERGAYHGGGMLDK